MARRQYPCELVENESLRSTRREVVRRHRAQPVLIESLLLAHEVEARLEKPTSTIPMNFILDLCRFKQKMHWLLPWRTLLVDETSRAPTHDLPWEIDGMSQVPDGIYHRDTFGSLARDENQQWDRIWAIDPVNFEFLAYVHLHPCEELYLNHCVGIHQNDLEHLEKCETLRSFKFETRYPVDGFSTAVQKMRSLESLNLETIYHKILGLKDQIALYQRLPNMTSLHINRLDDPYDVHDLVEYIRNRKETLQHVKLECCMERSVAQALVECKNILSLQINDEKASYDVIEPLVTCQHFQQSVKLLDLSSLNIQNFSFLKFFSALRWLTLNYTNVTNRDLRAVMLRNKCQMVEVSLISCHKITFRTFETIAHCIGLKTIDLSGCRIKTEEFEAYKENKRPNYEAIEMKYSAYRLNSYQQ